MSAGSISDKIQHAVEVTALEEVPLEERTRLLSEPVSGYLAGAFED